MNEKIQEKQTGRILVIDDDPFVLLAMRQTLEMHHFDPDVCDKPHDALPSIREGGYDAVVADVKMPKMNGLELLRHIREIDPELPVIMITGHGDIPMAVAALKEGAYDFLEKPVDDDVLVASLKRAVEKTALVASNRRLSDLLHNEKKGRSRFHNMIGFSSSMQKLYNVIEITAAEEFPVLITGETGTGKELVAKAIHDLSSRSTGQFIPINMGALPENMLETELFGHEAGAFTGATKRSIGKFEYAGKGTIFLDEICSMPLNLQVKLLRVIEEKKLQRLGSNEFITVHARIIVASNRDLKVEIEKGNFRADLYFRLNVIPIEVPPLRDRKEDIPLLAAHFIGAFNRTHEGRCRSVSEKTLKWMLSHDWPGNVRELENFINQQCILGEHAAGAGPAAAESSSGMHSESPQLPLRDFVDQAERQHIIQVLRLHQGQIIPASAGLGISRKSLYEKMKKHKIFKKDFKKLQDS